MKPDVKKALIEAVQNLIALAEEYSEELNSTSLGQEFDSWKWDGLDVDLNNAIDECERVLLLVEIADDAPSHG